MRSPAATGLPVFPVILLTSLALSACGPTAPGTLSTASPQADIRADVEQMADDFLARKPMRGLGHDMPLTAAYYWQDQFVARAAESMGAVVGYKTGGHDPGPGFPVFPLTGVRGAILEGMLRQSGELLSPGDAPRGFLEADFAVRVGSDAINVAQTDLELLAAIDAVIPFAEIPDPHYEEGTRTINGTIVANMGSRYSYVGAPVPIEPTQEWLGRLDNFSFAVTDESNTEIARGSIAGWYRPIEVIRWLRNHLVEGGKRLQPGDLLSLGNIGIIRQLHDGSPRGPAYESDEFTLQYFGLGDAPASVTIRIAR